MIYIELEVKHYIKLNMIMQPFTKHTKPAKVTQKTNIPMSFNNFFIFVRFKG